MFRLASPTAMMFGKRKFYLQADLSDGQAKKERNRDTRQNYRTVKERKRNRTKQG